MATPTGSPVSSPPPRILLVDDHEVFRMGVRTIIEQRLQAIVCAEASDLPTALSAARTHRPHCAVVDIGLPGSDGMELIKSLLAEWPHLAILVFSMFDESLYAVRALRAGAKGYLQKNGPLDEIQAALSQVLSGQIYISPELREALLTRVIAGSSSDTALPLDNLSDRELEVFRALGTKMATRDIADRLRVSVKTIETHRAHLKAKLGFSNGGDLVDFATKWIASQEAGTS